MRARPKRSSQREGRQMLRHEAGQRFTWLVTSVLAAAVVIFLQTTALAQPGDTIKVGYAISLTGQNGPLGKSAWLAHQIWEDEINANGGLLGRRVKLIYYDNQSNPATVPGIY